MPHSEVLDKDGIALPSVTQVIGLLAKPELFRWYAKNGFEECERIKKEAGEWGTELHSSISQFLKGEDLQLTSRCGPMFQSWESWYITSGFKPLVVEPEKPLESVFGYQGTFDAVGELEGELVVCDWKTSSKVYRENGLQLAAYAQLYEEQNPKQKIHTGMIVRIDKKTCKVQQKMFYNLPMYFKVFKSLLAVYPFIKRTGEWDGE